MIHFINFSDSFFTFSGICVTALCGVWIAYLSNKNKGLSSENVKLNKEKKDLSSGILVDLMSFNDIVHKVNNVFNQTRCDRFLILTAMNGKEDLRVCTVTYEQHNVNGEAKAYLSLGATGRYFNFAFDHAYRSMLKRIERYGQKEECIVAEMEDCDLKRIYMAEKVVEAHVYFLKRVKIDDENDRVFYCSYATHHEQGFKKEDHMTLQLYNDQLKHIMNSLIQLH
jgi:hypothetical protein